MRIRALQTRPRRPHNTSDASRAGPASPHFCGHVRTIAMAKAPTCPFDQSAWSAHMARSARTSTPPKHALWTSLVQPRRRRRMPLCASHREGTRSMSIFLSAPRSRRPVPSNCLLMMAAAAARATCDGVAHERMSGCEPMSLWRGREVDRMEGIRVDIYADSTWQ